MTLIGQRLRARSDVGTLPRLERIEYYTRWLEKYDSCSKIQASAFARVWLSKDLLSRSPGPAPLYRNFRRERRATIEARNADRELLQSAIPLSREALAQLIKLEDGIISKTKDRQEDLRLALDGIAECCYQLNAMDTLELQVRKCLKSLLQTSDPDQRVYLVFCRELAGTYMARLKYDQALQILEKVCSETAAGPASNTDRNGMIVDCSICLQKLGKIAQARARLTDLCKTTTEWTPWSEELTEQLVALGDLTEALKVAHLMEFDSGQLPGYSFGKAVQLQVGILELRGEPGEACDLCMKAINGAAEPRYSARLARADIPVLLALAANISSRNNNVRRMQIEKLVIEQIHRSGTDSSETIVLKKTLDELEAAKFKL